MKTLADLKKEILSSTEEAMGILVDEGIYETIEEAMEEQQEYLESSLSTCREEAIELFQSLNLSDEELEIIKGNYDTNGTASLTVLSLMGYSHIEDKESENAEIILEQVEDNELTEDTLADLLRAMGVAHYRHNNTSYDSIDKSKMSNEQVSSLRSIYNLYA